jgi:hypothetical protein
MLVCLCDNVDAFALEIVKIGFLWQFCMIICLYVFVTTLMHLDVFVTTIRPRVTPLTFATNSVTCDFFRPRMIPIGHVRPTRHTVPFCSNSNHLGYFTVKGAESPPQIYLCESQHYRYKSSTMFIFKTAHFHYSTLCPL